MASARHLRRLIEAIRSPDQLWSESEAFADRTTLPGASGVYGWYFRGLPGVPLTNCNKRGGFYLLYVGIAPSRAESSATLRKRIRTHFRGNASGSTLRFTLGCLLSTRLQLRFRLTGGSERITLGPAGEKELSAWLCENARVVWCEYPSPWTMEASLITELNVPLNLRGNERHPFFMTLSNSRSACRQQALAGRIDGED